MKSQNNWKPDLYDEKINFVSQYGKGILDMLEAVHGEKILDIGCGTGDLTNQISETGAIATGIDASSEMINTARSKFPNIPFIEADAADFRSEEKFNAVFSNAALHWMKNAEEVILSVKEALKSNGRFIAEFGGKDNIKTLLRGIDGFIKEDYGLTVAERSPWYFPSIGEYTRLLERNGFHVIFAQHFERPTTLMDGDLGLDYWLDSFTDDFFPELDAMERVKAYSQIKNKLRDDMFINGHWVLDYRRLRVIAIKE